MLFRSDRVMEELKRSFRPEFLNRIDEVIVFHSLTVEHIKGVVGLMIDRVNKQLAEKNLRIELTPQAADLLIAKGFDPTYGARQLRRTIQKHVEDPLAETIVRGQFPEGARILVGVEGEKFTFSVAQPVEPPLELAEH